MDCSYESNEHKNQEGHFGDEQPNPSPAFEPETRHAEPSEEQAFVFLTLGVYSWTLAKARALAVSRHCLHFMLWTFVGNFLKVNSSTQHVCYLASFFFNFHWSDFGT